MVGKSNNVTYQLVGAKLRWTLAELGKAFGSLQHTIINRISNFGRLPLCNQKVSHAPRVGAFCFPLCWRCTSILLAMLVGTYTLQPLVHIKVGPVAGLLLCVPCIIDGAAQRWFHVASTTFRRIATGSLVGLAIAVV